MLWVYFFAGGLAHLVQIHGIIVSSKYQQINNKNLTASAWNLPWFDLPSGQRSKPNIKINRKMGNWAQNEASAM